MHHMKGLGNEKPHSKIIIIGINSDKLEAETKNNLLFLSAVVWNTLLQCVIFIQNKFILL